MLLMSGGGGYLLSGTTVAADAAKARNQHKSEEPVAKRLKLDEISVSCDSSAKAVSLV